MTGIVGSLKKFEVVNFVSVYSETPNYYNGSLLQADGSLYEGYAFTLHLTLKNTGSGAGTINNIFLNSRQFSTLANITQANLINQTIMPGETLKGTITLPYGRNSGWTSGSSVEVEIETAAGNRYSNIVVLM